MTSCQHLQLVLLPEKHDRIRCRHCHLTLTADELPSRYCPECFETTRIKRYDFEEIVTVATGRARYRCEECGIIVESR